MLQNVVHDALLHSLHDFQRDLQIPTRQTPIASRLQRGIRLCGVDLPVKSDSKEKTGVESMFRTDIRMLICLVMDWWIVSATCFFIADSSRLRLTRSSNPHFNSSNVSTRMIRMRDSEIPSFSIPRKSLGIASASFSKR